MKIDLPVTIIFDCQETTQSAIMRSAGVRVCTLRYETDGDGTDAVLFPSYPPDEKPVLLLGRDFIPQGEPAQGIMAIFPPKADTAVTARAQRSPYDYLHAGVTDAERNAAQAKVDAAMAEDGPND